MKNVYPANDKHKAGRAVNIRQDRLQLKVYLQETNRDVHEDEKVSTSR